MKTKLDDMFKSDFLRLPRPFIRRFNVNTAIMLSEIYSEYTYWKERDGLQEGGWFYSTVENMYYNTGLSRHQQFLIFMTEKLLRIKYRNATTLNWLLTH